MFCLIPSEEAKVCTCDYLSSGASNVSIYASQHTAVSACVCGCVCACICEFGKCCLRHLKSTLSLWVGFSGKAVSVSFHL